MTKAGAAKAMVEDYKKLDIMDKDFNTGHMTKREYAEQLPTLLNLKI